MGLFDSLPPPAKPPCAAASDAPAKRPAPAESTEASVKKQRTGDAASPAPQQPASLPGTRLVAAYSEDKGQRMSMEDVAVINCDAGGDGAAGCRLSFFGVFDGHGGSSVARYAAEHLHACVLSAGLQQEARRLANTAAGGQQAGKQAGQQVGQQAGQQAGQQHPEQQQQQQQQQPSIKLFKAAVGEGFRELDRKTLEQCAAAGWPDGCTAVAVWVLADTVLVANVGDARCVLARRPQPTAASLQQQQPAPAKAEQHPAVPAGPARQQPAPAEELLQAAAAQQQAQAAGAQQQPLADGLHPTQQELQQPQQLQPSSPPQQAQQQAQPPQAQPPPPQQAQQQSRQQQQQQLKAITLTREHKAIFPQERQRIEKAGSFVSSDGRLAGRIEVSRAFGDRAFKKQGMSAVPDVQAFQISGARDAFLLLACDGFWGVFSPQDAVDFAQRELREKGHDVKQTCNRLIHEAIRERRCKDNCTVMLIQMQQK